jgi:siroheme synthase-like protein
VTLPIFVRLESKTCLVVGGGGIARRKAEDLLAAGARVRVVAPALTEDWRAGGPLDVEHEARSFAPGDCAGATLVFAATGDGAVDDAVAADARAHGAWVNAADRIPSCDFYSAAVVRRGPVQVAIGTGGASPAAARVLRERLDDALPVAFGALVEVLGDRRDELLARWPDFGARARVLAQFVRDAIDELPDDVARAQIEARLDAALAADD